MAHVHLLPGEEEVFRTRPHAATAWGPIIIVGLAALPLALALKMASAVAGAVVLLLYGAFVWYVIANRAACVVVVTDRRVIARSGIVSRALVDMNLSKIENSAVGQSISGRIFGFGTVVVTGTGGTRETFDGIEEAETLHTAIHMAREHASKAASQAPTTADVDLTEDGETKIHVKAADGTRRSYTLKSVDPAKVAAACAKLKAQGLVVLETTRT